MLVILDPSPTKVLAVTGPHATNEVLHAVHTHLPKPHDPFLDLVPPAGIKLTPKHYAYLKISEGCNWTSQMIALSAVGGILIKSCINQNGFMIYANWQLQMVVVISDSMLMAMFMKCH